MTAESTSSWSNRIAFLVSKKTTSDDSRKPVSQLAYPVTAPIPAMCKVAAYLL
jgi:hypothetical protein